jgi:hypothetical protein
MPLFPGHIRFHVPIATSVCDRGSGVRFDQQHVEAAVRDCADAAAAEAIRIIAIGFNICCALPSLARADFHERVIDDLAEVRVG